MVSQKFITQNARQTQKLAGQIANKLKGGEVLALYGELGSGKTTFVQGLAKGLGIKKRILSPSFTLIRSYTLSPKPYFRVSEKTSSAYTLYHIDLYRLNSPKEVKDLGLEEIWSDPKNICAIEWAEKIKEILPKKRLEIYFKYINNDKREIVFKNIDLTN